MGSGVENIFSTCGSFAALMEDGSVITWGYEPRGGDCSKVKDELAASPDDQVKRKIGALRLDDYDYDTFKELKKEKIFRAGLVQEVLDGYNFNAAKNGECQDRKTRRKAIDAVDKLIKKGAEVIIADCGFFFIFQDFLENYVDKDFRSRVCLSAISVAIDEKKANYLIVTSGGKPLHDRENQIELEKKHKIYACEEKHNDGPNDFTDLLRSGRRVTE